MSSGIPYCSRKIKEVGMSKEKAIEKLREILDRDDLCPKCKIRKEMIVEAIYELEKREGEFLYEN